MTHRTISDTIHSQLVQHKRFIDCLLTDRISRITGDNYILSCVLEAIEPGRRLRPYLFCETLLGLGGPLNDIQIDVIASIELLHTASILVDDVLDHDDVRHGIAVVERRWGNDRSVLFSHLIVANALKLLSFDSKIQEAGLDTYLAMCEGELYDMMYPSGRWKTQGYGPQVYRKTAALFEFVFSSAFRVSGSAARLGELLSTIGRLFGEFYQLANDFYDWQPHNLERRRVSAAEWPITFSFPLAVRLKIGDEGGLACYLDKGSLTRKEWASFLGKLWTPAVHVTCDSIMRQRRAELEAIIVSPVIPAHLQQYYLQMVQFVSEESCWYRSDAADLQ